MGLYEGLEDSDCSPPSPPPLKKPAAPRPYSCANCHDSSLDGEWYCKHRRSSSDTSAIRCYLCKDCFEHRAEIGHRHADWEKIGSSQSGLLRKTLGSIYESYYIFRSKSGKTVVLIKYWSEDKFHLEFWYADYVHQTYARQPITTTSGPGGENSQRCLITGKDSFSEFRIAIEENADMDMAETPFKLKFLPMTNSPEEDPLLDWTARIRAGGRHEIFASDQKRSWLRRRCFLAHIAPLNVASICPCNGKLAGIKFRSGPENAYAGRPCCGRAWAYCNECRYVTHFRDSYYADVSLQCGSCGQYFRGAPRSTGRSCSRCNLPIYRWGVCYRHFQEEEYLCARANGLVQ